VAVTRTEEFRPSTGLAQRDRQFHAP
jgi:hypothetical protein